MRSAERWRRDVADATWRRRFPLMCVRCLQRHLAGALYDSVTRDPLPPEAAAGARRWAEGEAENYLRVTFGES